MKKTTWIAPIVLTALLAGEAAGQATTPQPPVEPLPSPEAQAVEVRTEEAFEVRQELRDVLALYPTTLTDVVQLDPVLLTDNTFLEPYPALAAFLVDHPEVVHNPIYFFGSPYQSSGLWEPLTAFLVFLTMVGLLTWLIRTLIDYRRWNRLSKVQTEAHSKLLDRFTANEDLLAYIKTPAGQRFLESAPISLGTEAPAVGAPTNRILWSVQAGLVLALGGFGLHFAIPRLTDEGAADGLYVMGTLAIGLGIGFVLSAVASLIISNRLGLLSEWPGNRPDREGSTPPL